MSLRVRVLTTLLTSLVTALWLLLHHSNRQLSSQIVLDGIVPRQPPSVNGSSDVQTEIAAYVNSSDPKLIALAFGRHEGAFGFSPAYPWPLGKRALDPKYDCLVEKGRKYYESGILPAFDGHSLYPTPLFDEHSFTANGWSRFDEEDEVVPYAWKPVFAMVPEGRPPSGDESDRDEEVVLVYMSQDQPFMNAQGQETVSQSFLYICFKGVRRKQKLINHHQPPSLAYFHVYYLPETFAVIASTTYSSSYQLNQAGVPSDQIPGRTPPLHRLSDVIWAVWDSLVYHPGNLRYYAVDGIRNKVSQPLMEDIFNDYRGTDVVPWENRLTFGLDSKEGLALLGSPNGLAVAWILIHRAAEPGRRVPRVSIFNPNGRNRCMIWDLVPQGAEGVFGDPLHD
ncbi:MAG: hypothetical protein Q9203_003468 [Teloschistes exilis]